MFHILIQHNMRKYLITFLIIISLTTIIWGLIQYIQPLLSQKANASLILFISTLLSIFAILGPLKDMTELVASWSERSDLYANKLPSPLVQLRNRNRMLTKVHDFWIKGVFDKSLLELAFVDIGIAVASDAVQYPWESVLQRPNQNPHLLSPGTKIIDVFDQSGGELLILGSPGSGKTTFLLDLTRNLLTRALKDETLPIPIVFNLSSWTKKQPSFSDWLKYELNVKYDVPGKIGEAWINEDYIIPLLDGLDEVTEDNQTACIEAINHFRQEHGLSSMVLCSRINEYRKIGSKVKLQNAIIIQPLTYTQIDKYLETLGYSFRRIRALLQREEVLRELIVSPLMLNTMIITYGGLYINEPFERQTVESWQKHLFDAYINRMLNHRKYEKRIHQTKIIQWLSWLARQMIENQQSIFFIEEISPNWVMKRGLYKTMVACISILIASVTIGIVSGIIGIIAGRFTFALAGGIALGITCGVISLVGSWKIIDSKVQTVEKLAWSWQNARSGLLGGIITGIIVGLAILLFGWYSKSPQLILLSKLIGGLTLFTSVVGGLVGGLNVVNELREKVIPNQGIRQSFRSAITTAFVSWVFLGLIISLAFGLADQLLGALLFGAGATQIMGLTAGLVYGGLACVQHLAIRIALVFQDSIPINYVHFLDYCSDNAILRKVGGGYIFMHRLLLEHFAHIETSGKR